jgi:hypothetical protein
MTEPSENDALDSHSGDKFLGAELPEKIGKSLKKIYDDILEEPVPDDFLNLLSQADSKKSQGS